MKRLAVLLVCVLLIGALRAQDSVSRPNIIPVSVNKTATLVFPSPIVDADRGSADVLFQTVPSLPHILKIKANCSSFPETNITVYTADEKIYGVRIQYSAEPKEMIFNFTGLPLGKVTADTSLLTTDAIERIASEIAHRPGRAFLKRQKKHGISVTLKDVYFYKGTLFFRISLTNSSHIPLPVDFSRSYQRDKKIRKRSSVMEKEIAPLYTLLPPAIAAHATQTVVLAYPQFTIADNKFFVWELFERNGDRHVTIRLKGRHILKARPL